MISHQSQSTPITGYFEYLSRIRQRVNVTPYEAADSEETTTTTTTTITSPSVALVMDNDNTVSAADSSPADNLEQKIVNVLDKDATKWSSAEVQQWIEEQCEKFELKKAIAEKFQLNGQALVLLTKHDFLRRSPDGGEIIYYALQRLINPNKNNSMNATRNSMKNGSWRQNARIVELGSDTDEPDSSTGSVSSTKPIVEEPDDLPSYRKSDSDIFHENHQHQNYPHSYFHNNMHIHQPIFTMPSAAYYHQQQAFPNPFAYTHHHVHPHIPQQQFFHPHQHPNFIHQHQPMMSAQGILIELLDNEEAKNLTNNEVNSSLNDTSTNGASSEAQEKLFLVTIHGQRYVMNEEQVTQYVAEVQRQQQLQQQQQQHFHQQQQFHHQQQQQQQQQQQYTYQQRQPSQDNVFHTS